MEDHQYMFYTPPFSENDVSPNPNKFGGDFSFSFSHFSPNFFDKDDYGFFHNHGPSLDNNNDTTLLAGTVLSATAPAAAATETEAQTNNMAEASLHISKNHHHHGFPLNSFSDPSIVLPNKVSESTIPKKLVNKRPSGKADRHSKIVTAQGPRDRRIRLSLDIARRFFKLQDMLGVDKASKTVEWLLTKSKLAIEEVVSIQQKKHLMKSGGSNHGSSVSTSTDASQDISEIEGASYNVECQRGMPSGGPGSCAKEKMMRGSCKTTFDPLVRELRARARARARERTIEKKSTSEGLNKSKQWDLANTQNLNQFRSLSHYMKGEESEHAL